MKPVGEPYAVAYPVSTLFSHVRQVGVSPKLFARIARFEAALDRMARSRRRPTSEPTRIETSASEPQ
jgi:hypothetical protein